MRAFATGLGRLLLAGLALAMTLPTGVAQAQTYSTAALLDQGTPRPDGQGNFSVAWTVPVAFDGTHIAFVNFGTSAQEIWISDPAASTLTKLIDTTVKVPGGKGTFSTFVPPNNNLGLLYPRISGGKLVFWAEDATGGFGLYWIPLKGGNVHHIVDYTDIAPEGSAFSFINSFYTSGDKVLFSNGTGVYVGFTTSAPPVVVADGSTQIVIPPGPILYGCYGGAAIDGNMVALTASNCFDPSRGVNVVFVGPYNAFATAAKLPVVNSGQTLPGDGNATPHLDVISDNIFISGNLLYFGAQDTFSSVGFYGYYTAAFGTGGTPLAPSGSPIYRVFDNATSGLTGSFANFGGASFAQGTLAFIATANSDGTTGLYLASGASPTLVSTDLQRGVGTPLGYGEGRVAFGGAGFFDSQLDYVSASNCGVAPASQVKVIRGTITPGANAGEYLQTVTLKNNGPAIASGMIDLVLNGLTPRAALVDRSGVTACTTPIGSPFVTAGVSALATGAKTTVTLDVIFSGSTNFRYTPEILLGAGTP